MTRSSTTRAGASRPARVAGALGAAVTMFSIAGGLAPAEAATPGSPSRTAAPAVTVGAVTPSATTCSLVSASTGTSCREAIAFLVAQQQSGSTVWHNRCLALVSQAYGDLYAGYPTASSAARAVAASGRMHSVTSTYAIPRGAVVWLTNSTGAGHVVVSLGNGMAISSDVGNTSVGAESGGVGTVPLSYFTDTWGQRIIGWSAPVV